MILCIDVGNSHLYGGLFNKENNILLSFRHTSSAKTSDELGIFLRTVLRENGFNPDTVENIAICSVVPQIDYSLRAACHKYFDLDPFLLQAGVKTGLKINYRNPVEVGADRIANAIAATDKYPGKNLVIIDFGTATTFCVLKKDKTYLGGCIIPGFRLAADALSRNTAKLPNVEIVTPEQPIGRSTIESIQSGIYYSILGACREIISQIKQEFNNEEILIVATGGFAHLFEQHQIYDAIEPDLVLQGMLQALHFNH